MNDQLKIEKLELQQINYLIDGFKKWYTKNDSEIDDDNLFLISMDMYESGDTEIFSLKECNNIVGVFFIVEANNNIEIGGGLIEFSKSINNAFFVFDFCRNIAQKKKINTIKINVIKKHYKYEALLRLYTRYGFDICNINEVSVSLSLKITSP
jgi:hypothetical protein